MIFPFEQYCTFKIKGTGISSDQYLLNIIEEAMNDSKMTLTKKTNSQLRYLKTDPLKYPHPRNFLHNVSFSAKADLETISMKISTANWEILGLLLIALVLSVLNKKESLMVLIPVVFFVFALSMGIKQYLLRLVKLNLLQIIEKNYN